MEIGLWLPLWETVEQRAAEQGIAALDEDEQHWLVLRRAIDEVEQNGLLGLFCAEQPPAPVALLSAWQAISAEDMGNVFERAVTLLPNGLPPEEQEEREDLIELWQQDAYATLIAELEDDFYELLPEAEELLDEVVKRVLEKYE